MKFRIFLLSVILLTIYLCFFFLKPLFFFKNKSVQVLSIGYQSITAQTWGALLVKENRLIEKYYKGDKELKIIWSNFASGPPITSNMLANKIQLGFMGDMPLLINGDIGQSNKFFGSSLLVFDGKGENGINQDILVLKSSEINSFLDLKNKTISVPNSSSAHRLLLEELKAVGLTDKDVKIVFQDIPTGIVLLNKKEVDALAAWEPFPQYLLLGGNTKILPRQDKNKYLAGVVVNNDWRKNNPELVKAFVLALDEAHKILQEQQLPTVDLLVKETGFESSVVKLVISKIKWESSVLSDDLLALDEDIKFLQSVDKISKNFNLNEFISFKN